MPRIKSFLHVTLKGCFRNFAVVRKSREGKGFVVTTEQQNKTLSQNEERMLTSFCCEFTVRDSHVVPQRRLFKLPSPTSNLISFSLYKSNKLSSKQNSRLENQIFSGSIQCDLTILQVIHNRFKVLL